MSAPLTPEIPPVLVGLFDDAAVFPPGSLPIEEAVPAHVEHTRGAHAGLVGAFVLAAKDIGRLAELTADLPEGSLEHELAAAILAATRAGVAFKATAGLHHALRNTDPETGFEQHGFLNLLVATGAALDGAEEAELVRLLADRDGDRVAERVRALSPQVRDVFRSFGTCSVAEPAAESAGLGLLPAATVADLTEVSA
jgi:hypothetical protein